VGAHELAIADFTARIHPLPLTVAPLPGAELGFARIDADVFDEAHRKRWWGGCAKWWNAMTADPARRLLSV